MILIHSLFIGTLGSLPTLACSSPAEGEAGGSAGSAGSAGSTGSAGSGVTAGGDLCTTQFDTIEKTCPVGADSKDANVEDCRQQERQYAGIGCQAAFDAWVVCTSKPGYDCQQDSGCETQQNGYFACGSQAVQRTGCVHLGVQDTTRCSDAAKPFAFSCLAKAPAQCVQVVTEGAGIWCCPQL